MSHLSLCAVVRLPSLADLERSPCRLLSGKKAALEALKLYDAVEIEDGEVVGFKSGEKKLAA